MILIFYCLRITLLNYPALVVEKIKCWNDVCILICSLIECYENEQVCLRMRINDVRMAQVCGYDVTE